jgi:hypothetical protein
MQAAYSLVSDFFTLLASSLGATDVLLIVFAIALAGILQTNRQKSGPVRSNRKVDSVWQHKKSTTSRMSCDSDASKSTEAGDVSASEFSDLSSHAEGSGRRNAASVNRSRKLPGVSRSPAMGLNANTPTFVPGARGMGQPDPALNPDASCFVPKAGLAAPTLQAATDPRSQQNSQQLRDSIKVLKGALEEWEAKLPPENIPAAMDDGNALFEALAKLSPEQATMVKSMLDSKLGSCGPQPTRQANRPASRMAPFSQRPYTPFGERPNKNSNNRTPPRPADPGEESLSSQLKELVDIENARVLMVRRINRLGLNSAQPLKEHFSQFGDVDRVMVAPTRSKEVNHKVRVRPAPLGFVVMSTKEGAQAALARGSEHEVEEQSIGVFSFTSHSLDASQ